MVIKSRATLSAQLIAHFVATLFSFFADVRIEQSKSFAFKYKVVRVQVIGLTIHNLADILSRGLLSLGVSQVSFGIVFAVMLSLAVLWVLTGKVKDALRRKLDLVESAQSLGDGRFADAVRWLLFLLGSLVVATLLDIDLVTGPMLTSLGVLLNTPVIHVGKTSITLWSVLYVAVLWTVVILMTNRLQRWFADNVLANAHFDLGLRYATAAIVKYVVIALGFIVIWSAA